MGMPVVELKLSWGRTLSRDLPHPAVEGPSHLTSRRDLGALGKSSLIYPSQLDGSRTVKYARTIDVIPFPRGSGYLLPHAAISGIVALAIHRCMIIITKQLCLLSLS